MIEKIGVTKETENPIGGTIVKDENGEIVEGSVAEGN